MKKYWIENGFIRGDIRPDGDFSRPATEVELQLWSERLRMISALRATEIRDMGGPSPFQKEIHPAYDCSWCSACLRHLRKIRRVVLTEAENPSPEK